MMDLDFSAKLKNINCATLILCGEKDVANLKAARGLVENIQSASYRSINSAGHEVNTDKHRFTSGFSYRD